MVIGIVMVKSSLGQERSVYIGIREMEGIKNLYHTFGEFDFFLIAQLEDLSGLFGLIKNIREMSAVIKVETVLIGKDDGLQYHGPDKPAIAAA